MTIATIINIATILHTILYTRVFVNSNFSFPVSAMKPLIPRKKIANNARNKNNTLIIITS